MSSRSFFLACFLANFELDWTHWRFGMIYSMFQSVLWMNVRALIPWFSFSTIISQFDFAQFFAVIVFPISLGCTKQNITHFLLHNWLQTLLPPSSVDILTLMNYWWVKRIEQPDAILNLSIHLFFFLANLANSLLIVGLKKNILLSDRLEWIDSVIASVILEWMNFMAQETPRLWSSYTTTWMPNSCWDFVPIQGAAW